jgi:hypothetical protein
MQRHDTLFFTFLIDEQNLLCFNILVYTGPLFFGWGSNYWTAGYGDLLCDR